jgi:hypothetical protein
MKGKTGLLSRSVLCLSGLGKPLPPFYFAVYFPHKKRKIGKIILEDFLKFKKRKRM